MSNGGDYVKALEEERRKIQVFRRELPLCLELVTQAIERCKEQLSGESECSEETCCDVPVLEQFIPLKRDSSDSDSEEHESKKHKNETSVADCNNDDCNDTNCNKSDWLRSVQLWNQTPDPTPREDSATKVVVSEVKRDGAFHPFNIEKSTVGGVTATAPPLSPSSTAETGGGNKKEEKEGQRKARRCWSPELHRRFLKALQQLGGPHVATPKQIRELMKVDGLTNDEVKSHLQKYRLHTRRPSTSSHNNAQTPQFLVVGGIWVPPEYAAMTTTIASSEESGGAAANKIYAPVAAPPPPPFHEPPASPKQRRQIKPSSQSTNNGGYSKGAAVQSCSRGSSSTHTTTVSPAC